MVTMYGVWRVFLGSVVLNLGVLFLGLFVLVYACFKKMKNRRNCLFETSLLLFLVSFLYFTLHVNLLQSVFPISLPEMPLIDNNLTFNYSLTSILTYLIFPVFLLFVLRRDISFESFGLHILDKKQTLHYVLSGSFIGILLFLGTYTFFGHLWIPTYNLTGLILWILLVSVISGFCQTFFFVGVLFKRYMNQENTTILAILSVTAFQLFISNSMPWIIMNVLTSIVKVVITLKSRNIYAAIAISIIQQLTDVFVQIV
jgi:hypothetical protein